MSEFRRRLMMGMVSEDYSQYAVHRKTNAPFMAICYAQGWAENEKYMTFEEAAAVTSLPAGFLRDNNTVESLDELKYFTGITAIPNLAFYYCRKLKYITIPENIVSIGSNGSIARLLSLNRITWNAATPPNLGVYFSSLGVSSFIEFKTDNPNYSIFNKSLYSADGTVIYRYCQTSEIVFKGTETTIASYAFCDYLPYGELVAPQSITTINNGAFQNCGNLQLIDLSRTNVTTLPDALFRDSSVKVIILPQTLNSLAPNLWLYGNSEIRALIFNSISPPSLGTRTVAQMIQNSRISNNNDSYIYVPDASITDYKTTWSAIEDKIKPVSEYVPD